MANKDMEIILGGVVLPKFKTFKRTDTPNEADVVTLGGNLYTDFINQRREWAVGWDKLKSEDHDIIMALYRRQYQTEQYLMLQINAYGIYAPVKMNISSQNIRFNGSIIEAFSITLREQHAIS